MDKKKQLARLMESVDVLQDILDTEQYGLCMVDTEGRIVKWNYQKFFNIKEEDVLGKPVTEVLENTRLHIVVKTGEKELFQLQKIGGNHVIANRIPILHKGEIIGAAGTIVFKDIKELGDLHTRMEKMENRYKAYRSELANMYSARYSFDDIRTNNRKMNELKELSRVVARTEAAVLIQGESGTGKEMFAQAIHNESMGANEPFVSMNCSSIPKDLLESELFGYEAGAFTGAKKDGKMGKFELAGRGTIFLDEIGTMPMDMQVKLLRVLESREFERIGSTKKTAFRARVIAATNDELEQQIEEGAFRKDLYYRLNVVNIKIPPLRERMEDLPCLCQGLLEVHRRKYETKELRVSSNAMSVLRTHDWPGNVRELRNVLERAVILCQGEEILPEQLPEYLLQKAKNLNEMGSMAVAMAQGADIQWDAGMPHGTGADSLSGIVPDEEWRPEKVADGYFKQEVALLERRLIMQALAETNGNRKEAAKQLGIHRSLLYKKLEEYEIT